MDEIEALNRMKTPGLPGLLVLWLRSLLFFIGFLVVICFFAVLTCLVAFLPGAKLQSISTLGNLMILKWLRLICGISIEIEGLNNIPTCPTVFLSNHQSTFETFCLQRLLRPVATVLKKSLFFIPFFGWTLYLQHPIAIDRGSPKSAMKQVLTRGVKRLTEGYNVLIYPEGTRISHGVLAPFARSGAALAIKAGVPVVPVAHNAGRLWPRQFIKYPGTIRVMLGPPIVGCTDSKQLNDQARSWIEEQLERC